MVRGFGRKRREQNIKRAPPAGAGVHPDGSPLRPHDAGRRRESQTPALELGSEEGIEDPALSGLIHARAGIANLDADIGAGAESIVWKLPLYVLRTQIASFRPDQYGARLHPLQ